MILFAFLILPVFLVWFCFYLKTTRIVPAILFGAVEAVLLCLFLTLFVFSHRIIPFSFFKNLVHLSLTQTVLPVIISFLFYVLISKDSRQIKTEAFLPLETTFFSVYLPYTILITSRENYSGFLLFFKPVLFLIMILLCAFSLKKIFENFVSKKTFAAILFIFVFIVALFIPPVAETIWLIK